MKIPNPRVTKTIPARIGFDRTNANKRTKIMKPMARTMAWLSSSSRSYQFLGLDLGAICQPENKEYSEVGKKIR